MDQLELCSEFYDGKATFFTNSFTVSGMCHIDSLLKECVIYAPCGAEHNQMNPSCKNTVPQHKLYVAVEFAFDW